MSTTLNEKITEMFREHADSLLRMSFLYLKDRHLAEDAVQETFLNAYRNLEKFKGNSSEKTWLTRIAINACKNIMRSPGYRHPHTELTEQIPDNSVDWLNTERVSVSAEVGKLPLKYREAVLLYYYRELTTEETAKLLKVPRTTVEYRLRRAKTLLRKTLKECYFNE
ncbi:MAG: sigma-70 family RNA polymerase sigma factor [Oscillospiraceae bacterium]|nr:sigma-70 family RNA polymerase sigma factor [Oscillospiraceae bacterium]